MNEADRQQAPRVQAAAPPAAAAPAPPAEGYAVFSPFLSTTAPPAARTQAASTPWYLQLGESDLGATALVLAVAALLFVRLLRRVWEG